MTTTSPTAPAALRLAAFGPTEYSRSSGTSTGAAPVLFAEGTHNGHAIQVWKQATTQTFHADAEWNTTERTYEGTRSQVLVDGKNFGEAPVGTAKVVLRKIAAKLDTIAEDDALRAELTRLIDRGYEGTEFAEATEVGAVVYVYAMGSFRRGIVVRVTATKAVVAFTTASSGGRIFRKDSKITGLRVAPAAVATEETPAVDRATQAIEDARAHLAAHPELTEEPTAAVRVGQRIAEAVLLTPALDALSAGPLLRAKVQARKATKDGTRLLHLTVTERAALAVVARETEETARKWIAEGDRRAVSLAWSAQRLLAALAA